MTDSTRTPELLGWTGKTAVVSVPGRRFPGLFIPADTAFSWLQALNEESNDDSGVEEVRRALEDALGSYATLMAQRDDSLPFAWPRD